MFAAACIAALLLGVSHYAQALHWSTNAVYRKRSSSELGFELPPRAYARSTGSAVIPAVDQQGFWFSNFTIGAANNQLMLIDTGSSDVVVNYGEYQPGPQSVNKNTTVSERYGTTNPDGTGTATITVAVYQDLVASGGLASTNQLLGVQKKPTTPFFPNNGIVGYSSTGGSSVGGAPWVQNLCNNNITTECRFGLAFNTDNTGTQVVGTVDTSLFNGSLSVVPVDKPFYWVAYGDVTVQNKVFKSDVGLQTDSGTTVILGPLSIVSMIFQQLGLNTSQTTNGAYTYLHAFFPCNNTPVVGFAFPSATQVGVNGASSTSTNFNILPKAMAFANNGNNNCTAALQGWAKGKNDQGWLIGQPFFQGHYIDHNYANGTLPTMGFANLN